MPCSASASAASSRGWWQRWARGLGVDFGDEVPWAAIAEPLTANWPCRACAWKSPAPPGSRSARSSACLWRLLTALAGSVQPRDGLGDFTHRRPAAGGPGSAGQAILAPRIDFRWSFGSDRTAVDRGCPLLWARRGHGAAKGRPEWPFGLRRAGVVPTRRSAEWSRRDCTRLRRVLIFWLLVRAVQLSPRWARRSVRPGEPYRPGVRRRRPTRGIYAPCHSELTLAPHESMVTLGTDSARFRKCGGLPSALAAGSAVAGGRSLMRPKLCRNIETLGPSSRLLQRYYLRTDRGGPRRPVRRDVAGGCTGRAMGGGRGRRHLAARGWTARSGGHGDVVCQVVPVLIGDTLIGRTDSGRIVRAGLVGHFVEQPAVASGAARFRLQAMADHRDDDVDTAIDILDYFIREVGVSRR